MEFDESYAFREAGIPASASLSSLVLVPRQPGGLGSPNVIGPISNGSKVVGTSTPS